MAATKRCGRCGETKPTGEFHRRRRSKDGLQGNCKQCNCETRREWQRANRERVNEHGRQWRANNRERHREIHRASNARQRSTFPGKLKRMAGRAVWGAVQNGTLEPQPCQQCGADGYFHHDSYHAEHWLHVRPLCHDCHMAWHRENLPYWPSKQELLSWTKKFPRAFVVRNLKAMLVNYAIPTGYARSTSKQQAEPPHSPSIPYVPTRPHSKAAKKRRSSSSRSRKRRVGS